MSGRKEDELITSEPQLTLRQRFLLWSQHLFNHEVRATNAERAKIQAEVEYFIDGLATPLLVTIYYNRQIEGEDQGKILQLAFTTSTEVSQDVLPIRIDTRIKDQIRDYDQQHQEEMKMLNDLLQLGEIQTLKATLNKYLAQDVAQGMVTPETSQFQVLVHMLQAAISLDAAELEFRNNGYEPVIMIHRHAALTNLMYAYRFQLDLSLIGATETLLEPNPHNPLDAPLMSQTLEKITEILEHIDMLEAAMEIKQAAYDLSGTAKRKPFVIPINKSEPR